MLLRLERRSRRASHSHNLAAKAFEQAGADQKLLDAFEIISRYYKAIEDYGLSPDNIPTPKHGRKTTGERNVQELCKAFLNSILPKKPRKQKVKVVEPKYEDVFDGALTFPNAAAEAEEDLTPQPVFSFFK